MCWAGCQQAGNQFVETMVWNMFGSLAPQRNSVWTKCWAGCQQAGNQFVEAIFEQSVGLGASKLATSLLKQSLNKVLGWVPASWQPVCWNNLWTKCWAGCQQAGNQFVETIFEQSVGLVASKLATSLLKQSLNKVLGWVPASWQPVCWNNLWTKCWAGCQQAGNQFVETIFEQSVGLGASKLATSLLEQCFKRFIRLGASQAEIRLLFPQGYQTWKKQRKTNY